MKQGYKFLPNLFLEFGCIVFWAFFSRSSLLRIFPDAFFGMLSTNSTPVKHICCHIRQITKKCSLLTSSKPLEVSYPLIDKVMDILFSQLLVVRTLPLGHNKSLGHLSIFDVVNPDDSDVRHALVRTDQVFQLCRRNLKQNYKISAFFTFAD